MDKLPKGWESLKISEACTFRPPKKEVSHLKDIEVSFVPMATVKECQMLFYPSEEKKIQEVYKGYTYFKDNDVLLAKVTPCFENGKSAIAKNLKNGIGFGSSEFYVLRPNSSILSEWMYWHLCNNRFLSIGKNNMSGAVGLKRLTQDFLLNYQITLPPLPEQKRIVSKLDALFKRIDKCMALLEENIKHTESLMASALDEVFTITSRRVSISDLIEKTKNINPKQNPNQELTYIDITSINNKTHIIEDPKFVKGVDAPSRARKGVEYGDILFATTRPNLRNIAVINKSYNNPVASTGFCVLRVKKDVNSDFLFNCLLSNEIQKQITPFIRGAQYPAISDKNLTSCEVPALEFKEQNAIAERIKLLRDKAIKLQEEQQDKLNNLKALKESILDRAFKGKI